MSIKLIALDLDGTLLDSRKRLSPQNKQALEACIARGVYIVPCTGRVAMGIPEEIRCIPGIRYAITVNGATIEDMETGQILESHLLDKEAALEIMELAREYPVMYDVYAAGQGISENRFLNDLEPYGLTEEMIAMIRRTRKAVPDIREYVRQWPGQVDKVNLFFHDPETRSRLRKLLEAREDILVSSSLPTNLEINGAGAAKGNALLALAEHLGLKREETMACGDGDNDISMIKMAGLGVAMENAVPDILEAADWITGSNDESGVAKAIETWVLNDRQ